MIRARIPSGLFGGGGASVTTSDTPPSSPSDGDLWWDSAQGELYVWYVDNDSGQWVIASPGGGDSTSIDVRGFSPSTTVDSRTQLQAAINAAAAINLPLDLAGITWRCDDYLTLPTRLHLRNGGLDFSHGPIILDGNDNFMLRGIGTLGVATPLLALDALADQPTPQTITLAPGGVAALGGLLEHDMLFVRSNQIWLAPVPMGELAIVRSVSGDVVTIQAPLRYGYAVADGAMAQKIAAPVEDMIFRNLDVIGAAPLAPSGHLRHGGFFIQWGRRILFDNVRIRNLYMPGVTFWGIDAGKFLNGSVMDTPNWYGVVIAGPCRDIVVDGSRFINNRHGVTVSSSGSFGGGIPTDVIVSNNYVEGRDAGLDGHPWADKVTFTNNMIHCTGGELDVGQTGITYEGRTMFAENNKITGNANQAIRFQPRILATTGLRASCTMIGNFAETTNPQRDGIYAYAVWAGHGAGMAGIDNLVIDSVSRGPWEGGVQILTINEITNLRIGGSYSGMVRYGVILQAMSNQFSAPGTGGQIRQAVISGLTVHLNDVQADYGIGLYAPTDCSIKAIVTGTMISGVSTALRRVGVAGGAIRVMAYIVSDATNIITSFLPGDECWINGYGLVKVAADRALGPDDTGWTFSNEGAPGNIEFQLPAAVPGLHYKFFCASTNDLVVRAFAGDKIWLGGTATAVAGGIVATNPGGAVEVWCQNGTDWYATNNTGFVISGVPGPVAFFFDFMVGTLPAGVAIARAGTVGPYFNNVPSYLNAAANVARFDYDGLGSLNGLHNEASIANGIRNSALAGDASGTPGTAPTNWVVTGSVNGIVRTITAGLTESGMQCADFRFVGTPTASFTIGITFETTTGGPVATYGQTWTSSYYARLMAGTWDNVGAVANGIVQYDAGGIAVGTLASAASPDPSVDPLVTQRNTHGAVLTAVTVARIASQIRMPVLRDFPVDFTIRVALPNLCQEDRESSPIETSGTALTRASELVTLTMTAGFYDIDVQYRGAETTTLNVDVSGGTWVVPHNGNRQLQSVTAYEV